MNDLVTLVTSPTILPWVCGVLGLLVGSFLNVVAYRLPIMMMRDWEAEVAAAAGKPLPEAQAFSLSHPPSRCPTCEHKISAMENIPVVSWLFLRGKCAACKTPIALRYPLVETASALLSFVAGAYFSEHPLAAFGMLFFTWVLIAASLIDFDTQLLPDSLTLPLLWLGLLINLNGTFATLNAAVIGAVAGYLSLWSLYWAFKLLTGKEGMGYGDFKLLAALGAWLGWQMLPALILLSALAGSIIGIGLILIKGRNKQVPIPFGPYLAIAGLLTAYVGKDINAWYLSHWLGM